MITVKNILPVFTKVKWVLQAICKDTTRNSLCYLYVDLTKDRMVCTDGKILLYATTDGLFTESGFYRVVVNTVKEIVLDLTEDVGTYPNVDLVAPPIIKDASTKMQLDEYVSHDITVIKPSSYKGASKTINVSHIFCQIAQMYDTPMCLDFTYLQQVCKSGLVDLVVIKKKRNKEVDASDKYDGLDVLSPVYFTGEDVMAVVMPVRV